MTIGLTLQIWPGHGHYAAPASGAVLLILLSTLRSLRSTGRPHLLWFSRAIVLGMLVWMLVPIADRLWNPFSLDNYCLTDLTTIPRQVECERLRAHLNQLPGQHLVLVHYHVGDIPSQDWIYNRADIDSSKIVWARDMGPQANQELLHYYPNRQVWYIDHSGGPVVPYATVIASNHSANPVTPDR
jgi:hypothetical protein